MDLTRVIRRLFFDLTFLQHQPTHPQHLNTSTMEPSDPFQYAPKDVRDAVEKFAAGFEACKRQVEKIKLVFSSVMKMRADLIAYEEADAREDGTVDICE